MQITFKATKGHFIFYLQSSAGMKLGSFFTKSLGFLNGFFFSIFG